jgi:uroporphyrinogen decarboxylase
MKKLTGRERLLRSFKKLEVDRVPVSPFIYGNFVKAFFNDPGVDLTQGTIDVYRHFGFDLMLRNFNVRYDELQLVSPAWQIKTEETGKENTATVKTVITTPERKLQQVVKVEKLSPFHQVKANTEWFIKDEEDFEQFVKYQPPVPKLEFPELKRAKRLIGEEGITAPWISGVFNTVTDYRKLDDLIMDAMVQPEFYHRMMGYFLGRLQSFTAQVTSEGVDVLSYGGNIANGSMVGPDFFRGQILNYEKKLVEHIQEKGTHVLYHNCGDAKKMIEVYNDLGIDGFESLTEPPYGDNDLKDAVSRFDRSVTLIGNIDQITFLRKATPEEVKTTAYEKLKIAGPRKGFILGTSDFLEEDTPRQNLFALAEAVERTGIGRES